MRITTKMLKQVGASCSQLTVFNGEWPDGVDVTKASCLRAVDLRLDVDWAARHLLSGPALAKYKRAIDAAWGSCQWPTTPAGCPLDVKITWGTEYAQAYAAEMSAYRRACALAFLAGCAAMEEK